MATKGDISDLEVLVYGGQPVVPLVEGFTRTRQGGVVRSDVSGGASRQRKKYYGTTHLAQATFHLSSPAMQDYIQMFINSNEGKRWICHLSADRPLVEPYVVQALTDWNHVEVNALRGTVTVQLEIFSARDECLDGIIYPLYQCIGDDLCEYLDLMQSMTDGWPTRLPVIQEVEGVTLDFINQRYYKNTDNFDFVQVVNFTRASIGTDFVDGVLTDFAVNTPRIGDEGFLVERAATNWLLNTDNVVFSYALNTTVTRNNEWYQARKTVVGGGATYLYVNHTSINGVVPVSQYVCCSCFVKINDSILSGQLRLNARFDGSVNYQYVDFDISNNLTPGVSTSGIISSGSKIISPGVYQIFITLACTVSNNSNRSFYITVPTIDIADEVQYEVAYPQVTSYLLPLSLIINQGTQITRQPDVATVNVSDISQKIGVVYVEYFWDGVTRQGYLFNVGDNSVNNRITCYHNTAGLVKVDVVIGSATVVRLSTPNQSAGSNKIAVKYEQNTISLYFNGEKITDSYIGNVISDDQINVGAAYSGFTPINTHLKSFWYRPYLMTDAQLIEVTS